MVKGHRLPKETLKKLSAVFKGKTWKLIDGKRVWFSKEAK